MATAIRLSRHGRKKKAFYKIVVMDSRDRRDGCPIEDLGWYDPHTDKFRYNQVRLDYWLNVGAQPSDRVKYLMKNPQNNLFVPVLPA